ncbi:MAG TPA: DPP IV N-terminal domain-containing protein, partial [Bryobacteraceae bacterium]|nr:DPP IV N-terminal domain-containing protein [Bryobacteraceae bacterium]
MRFLSLLLVGISVWAAEPSARLDNFLERAFAKNEFTPKTPAPPHWSEDGKYTSVENDEVVQIDARSGSTNTLLSRADLTPAGSKDPLKITSHEWSKGRRKLLIYTNAKKVWRQNTRGDYWLFDVSSRKLRKLGGDAAPSTLMFAKFSPDESKVAYVRANDLYCEDLSSGKITRLTHDGSPVSINGTSDWVYEEELNLRDGFRWSPDSKHIAFWHFDATGVGDFVLVNQTDSLYPAATHIPYPKVGTSNSAVKVGVISAAGGDPVWLDVPGDPRQHYIALVEWADKPQEVV